MSTRHQVGFALNRSAGARWKGSQCANPAPELALRNAVVLASCAARSKCYEAAASDTSGKLLER